MEFVVFDACIPAADDSCQSSDTAIDDVVVKRSVAGPEHAAEQVANGLVAESHDHVLLFGGDGHLVLVAIREIVYGVAHDLFRGLKSVSLVVIIVLVSPLHLRYRARCNHLGMEALRQIREPLHHALHIHHHGFHRAGYYGYLLLEIVPGNGYPVAHEDFVGGAADAAKADSAAGA